MPEGFLSVIVTMLPALQEIEQRLDRETGRRFNAFNLFAMNENATSRILAFLLDPNEAHGQNDVFLRLFIRRFVPEWQRVFNYPKAHMAWTGQLIDVVISDGPHWLGIENKIFDAPEQERQAGRYLEALQDAPHLEGYRLVYLSPKGAGPNTKSLPNDDKLNYGANLVCGAWAHADGDDDEGLGERERPSASILDWLTDCQVQCRAENVTWLIKQFHAYVASEITGHKESDMADTAIVGLALKDEKTLEAALRIGENFVEIRRNVMREFLKCVQGRLEELAQKKEEDWEVTVKWPGGNWIEQPVAKFLPLLLRKRAWPALMGVAIQAEMTGPFGIFIGICGPMQDEWNKDVSGNTRLYGEQNKFCGKESRYRIAKAVGRKEPQYPWWVYYDKIRDAAGQDISDWRETATITRLYSEKDKDALCTHIIDQMTDLAAKIGSLVIDPT